MYHSIQFTKTTSSRRTPISRWRRCILRSLTAGPALLLLLLASATAFCGSATWNLNPPDGFWGAASNWTPATVPNGPNDTATFDISNITDIDATNNDSLVTEVNGIVFNVGASAFTITVATFISFDLVLTISGVGITNNSGITQEFVAAGDAGVNHAGLIQFTNGATAGELTTFTSAGASVLGFRGGVTQFFGTATAASATLIANNTLSFDGSGGLIQFADDSTGGTARVEVFGNGKLDIGAHNAPGVTVGSVEGTGKIILGANNLTIGSNNLSTNFSGRIKGEGSLTKIGTGKLTLSGSNLYNGGTVVDDGTLLVNNKRTSGTGKGPVQVNAGTLGGAGTIGGPVTVGTGSGSGAFLSPGITVASHRTLTLRGSLTFNSDASYRCGFNSSTSRADKVVANGVTINGGAQFSFEDSNASALPLGTVFTVISNTAATPIAGTFSNLADGSTIIIGSNTFQASYEGGDGNDLTLTVVP